MGPDVEMIRARSRTIRQTKWHIELTMPQITGVDILYITQWFVSRRERALISLESLPATKIVDENERTEDRDCSPQKNKE